MSYRFYKTDNEEEAVLSAITANAKVLTDRSLPPKDLNFVARVHVLL
jgi:hypothetical protein